MVKTYIHLNREKIEADRNNFRKICDEIISIYRENHLNQIDSGEYDLAFIGIGNERDEPLHYKAFFALIESTPYYGYLDKCILHEIYNENEITETNILQEEQEYRCQKNVL